MAWVRIDDAMPEHEKFLHDRISDAEVALWLRALCRCNRLRTDGFVATVALRKLSDAPNPAEVAENLVAAGLWERTDRGYVFHDFGDYQPLRAQVEQATSDARQKAGRAGGLKSAAVRAAKAKSFDAEANSKQTLKQSEAIASMLEANAVGVEALASTPEANGKQNEAPDPDPDPDPDPRFVRASEREADPPEEPAPAPAPKPPGRLARIAAELAAEGNPFGQSCHERISNGVGITPTMRDRLRAIADEREKASERGAPGSPEAERVQAAYGSRWSRAQKELYGAPAVDRGPSARLWVEATRAAEAMAAGAKGGPSPSADDIVAHWLDAGFADQSLEKQRFPLALLVARIGVYGLPRVRRLAPRSPARVPEPEAPPVSDAERIEELRRARDSLAAPVSGARLIRRDAQPVGHAGATRTS